MHVVLSIANTTVRTYTTIITTYATIIRTHATAYPAKWDQPHSSFTPAIIKINCWRSFKGDKPIRL